MPFVNTPKLALPGSAVKGDGAGSWVAQWNQICANLEARLAKGGVGTPVGLVAGDYVGQAYFDTSSFKVYWCTLAGIAGVATWTTYQDGAYLGISPVIGQLAAHTANAQLAAMAYRALPARSYVKPVAADASITGSGAEFPIPLLVNLAIPGTPNGIKKYCLNFNIPWEMGGALDALENVRVFVHLGPLGTIIDPAIYMIEKEMATVSSGAEGTHVLCGWEFAPALTDKLSIGIAMSDGGTVYHSAIRGAFVEIMEIFA